MSLITSRFESCLQIWISDTLQSSFSLSSGSVWASGSTKQTIRLDNVKPSRLYRTQSPIHSIVTPPHTHHPTPFPTITPPPPHLEILRRITQEQAGVRYQTLSKGQSRMAFSSPIDRSIESSTHLKKLPALSMLSLSLLLSLMLFPSLLLLITTYLAYLGRKERM